MFLTFCCQKKDHVAFRSPPFRKCHMLPCLLATMVVFPLFLHIFIHVLYLTCFQHPCVLVLVMLPCRHDIFCPVFLSHFIATACSCPALLHFPVSFPLEFPTFSSTVSSDNMFVRYLHCGVQLTMTPLPSLPSSHRFTSTSQMRG